MLKLLDLVKRKNYVVIYIHTKTNVRDTYIYDKLRVEKLHNLAEQMNSTVKKTKTFEIKRPGYLFFLLLRPLQSNSRIQRIYAKMLSSKQLLKLIFGMALKSYFD